MVGATMKSREPDTCLEICLYSSSTIAQWIIINVQPNEVKLCKIIGTGHSVYPHVLTFQEEAMDLMNRETMHEWWVVCIELLFWSYSVISFILDR